MYTSIPQSGDGSSKFVFAIVVNRKRKEYYYHFMNKYFSISLLFTSLLSLSACDESDQLDVDDIEIPRGYALSAGTSTGFYNSSVAYDQAARWLSGTYDSRFNAGDRLYDNVKTSNENGHGGGLGPVYAGYSCGSCHRNAGRTEPTYWTSFKNGGNDGSGPYGFTASLIYITRKNGTFFPNYGRVIHDQAIYGVHPEGKLKVEIDSMAFSFPDGEKYTLCVPKWSITEWYADSISPNDLFCTVRVPLRHVGMGQMMAIDPNEIEALARKSNYPEWGISGRANYINERGKLQLGLSGNKAQHADLTVELAQRHNATAIVKGVRSVKDYEYERDQAEFNRVLGEGLETVLICSRPEYSTLSSSILRTLQHFGRDISEYQP